jgi:hypothetical protein
MAFSKFARAAVTKPEITASGWDEVRSKDQFMKTASKVVFKDYDPKDYLITHCTIVASVNTEDGPGEIGKQVVDGFQIDRRYPNYLVTTETAPWINNNNDAFERRVLLATYKTFIGSHNYVEHLQIPALSKGKIIDAAARDIGNSIYIDILVATEKKHQPLIAAITGGKLQTLSMGCFLPGSQVTMADGTRVAIEDVSPGDMVVTHKGRVREVLNKQIRVGRWGVRRVNAVGLPSSITATDNHPFFVLRPRTHCACGCGEELKAKDRDPVRRLSKRYKVGHDKRVFNHNNTYSLEEARRRLAQKDSIRGYTLEEVRADELRTGDYLCFPRIGSELDCPDDVTIGKARLLGLFIAEGSFLKHKGEATEVQFNFSLDERQTLAKETVDLLAQEFGVEAWVQEREDKTTCTVHAYGRDLAKWFKYHGGEYAPTKRLSFEAFSWPVKIQKALVGGWLDGDGGRSIDRGTRRLTGVTTSYALVCQMHAILARIGVFTQIACRFGGHAVEVREAVNGGVTLRHPETGHLASFELEIGARQLSRLDGVCLKAEGDQANTKARLRVLDDVMVFPITSVEPLAYEGPVHDMEVDEDHSYIVEGVAVHNCTVAYTQCTKCGNVAEDESQLCPHIRYFKGSEFYDALGKKRKIAELCGHYSDPESVKFIEASWVGNPAFRGAVLRSILTEEEANKVAGILDSGMQTPSTPPDPDLIQKAAMSIASAEWPKQSQGQQFDLGDMGMGESDAPKADKKDEDPIEKLVGDLADSIRERALKKIRDEIGKGEAQQVNNIDLTEHNESLIKSAMAYPAWRVIARSVLKIAGSPTAARRILAGLLLHRAGGWKAVQEKGKFSGSEILAISRVMDLAMRKTAMAGERRLYKVVVAARGVQSHPSETEYLGSCHRILGRDMTDHEKAFLIAKGRLFSMGS